MTGIPSACSDHDSVADKARNDKKARKKEHDSVADKAKNDKKARKKEHDSVADKARNDKKARKKEHDSVADKARNDKKTKEELTFITLLSLPSLATLALTRADVQVATVVTQLGAAV